MLKVWHFKYEDSNGDILDESFHATEELAYRSACQTLLTYATEENWDFGEETVQDFFREFLGAVDAGDYRAAIICYNTYRDKYDWVNEDYYVEELELLGSDQLDLVGGVLALRARLSARVSTVKAEYKDEAIDLQTALTKSEG